MSASATAAWNLQQWKNNTHIFVTLNFACKIYTGAERDDSKQSITQCHKMRPQPCKCLSEKGSFSIRPFTKIVEILTKMWREKWVKKNRRNTGSKSERAKGESKRANEKDLIGNFKKHCKGLFTFKRNVSMIYTAKFVTIKNIRVFLPYFRSKISKFYSFTFIKISVYLVIQMSLNTFSIHL